jgi:hypothetical protein
LVGLRFEHLGDSFFIFLPNRPAGGQPYSFTTPINVPWVVVSGGGLGPHEYEVMLLTTPVAGGSSFEVSTRVQLRRDC